MRTYKSPFESPSIREGRRGEGPGGEVGPSPTSVLYIPLNISIFDFLDHNEHLHKIQNFELD